MAMRYYGDGKCFQLPLIGSILLGPNPAHFLHLIQQDHSTDFTEYIHRYLLLRQTTRQKKCKLPPFIYLTKKIEKSEEKESYK